MKKILMLMMAVLSVFCLTTGFTGKAEAAKVAVLPIQLNEEKVERASDWNSWYWDIIVDRFHYPDFELIDDTSISQVVPESGLTSYDKETLMSVASQLGADVVVAMRIDNVHEKFYNFRTESMIGMTVEGQFASYNGVTGKYYDKKINSYDETEDVYLTKTDWQARWMQSNLNRYINRTIETK
ncbi:MAG: Lipoprotein [Succiniclasticum sp.]|jgi:hypothetical protein